MTTTVINKRSPGFKPNANQRYIGRGSLWGNPFTHLPLSRAKAQFHVETEEESMLRYEAWLREKLAKDPQLRQKLLDLDGHELVCYCKPAPCHGDILIRIIEELKQSVPIIPAATTSRDLHCTRGSEAPAGTSAGKLPSRQLCRPSSRSPCPAEDAYQPSPCFRR